MSNKNESIPLDKKLRFLNFVVDSIGIYFFYWLFGSVLIFVAEKFFNFDSHAFQFIMYEDKRGFIIYYGTVFSVLAITIFLYYSILEYFFQKTWGKVVTRSKVVSSNYEKPSFKTIVIRTICRFIPIDWITFLFSRNGMHDRLSKTKVIKV